MKRQPGPQPNASRVKQAEVNGLKEGPDAEPEFYRCSFAQTSAYCFSTLSTASVIFSEVVSSRWVFAPCCNGATVRLLSRASRSRISCKRVAILASIPFSINCLYLRCALVSALAVGNILRMASGNTTDPMSRPSATRPGSCRNSRCRSRSAVPDPGIGGNF